MLFLKTWIFNFCYFSVFGILILFVSQYWEFSFFLFLNIWSFNSCCFSILGVFNFYCFPILGALILVVSQYLEFQFFLLLNPLRLDHYLSYVGSCLLEKLQVKIVVRFYALIYNFSFYFVSIMKKIQKLRNIGLILFFTGNRIWKHWLYSGYNYS